jgi:hypothetical protein
MRRKGYIDGCSQEAPEPMQGNEKIKKKDARYAVDDANNKALL